MNLHLAILILATFSFPCETTTLEVPILNSPSKRISVYFDSGSWEIPETEWLKLDTLKSSFILIVNDYENLYFYLKGIPTLRSLVKRATINYQRNEPLRLGSI